MARRKTQYNYRQLYEACPVKCYASTEPATSLSEYLGILDVFFKPQSEFLWCRGHADLSWELTPSVFRGKTQKEIRVALELLTKFQRQAEYRIERPPPFEDGLRWMQLAQHYGLPTQLLDWTANAAVALYFACLQVKDNGMVFVMDPTDLNIKSLNGARRLLDPEEDKKKIDTYLRLIKNSKSRISHNVAIQPVFNSERIRLQRGAFTLHGNGNYNLTDKQAPSLCYVPILAEHKNKLMKQLMVIGIDESTIYPEPEHICNHLKRVAGINGDNNA